MLKQANKLAIVGKDTWGFLFLSFWRGTIDEKRNEGCIESFQPIFTTFSLGFINIFGIINEQFEVWFEKKNEISK